MEYLTSEIFIEYEKSMNFVEKYKLKSISDLDKIKKEFRELSLFQKEYIIRLLEFKK